MSRLPWTRAELEAILPRIERQIAETEEQWPAVRPLPPMTPDECRAYLNRLMELAKLRPLTGYECFLHGQLQAAFEHAIRAETLGYRGRYFVLSEADIMAILKSKGSGDDE